MATMLSATTVMNSVLLLVAANEDCPQPQTSEHMAALAIMKIKNILIVQNKIDLVSEDKARDQHEAIKKFVSGNQDDCI